MAKTVSIGGNSYTGIEEVNVNGAYFQEAKESQTKTVTPTSSTQTIRPDTGKELTQVTVYSVPTETKTVVPGTERKTVTPSSGKFLSAVYVEPIGTSGGDSETKVFVQFSTASGSHRYLKVWVVADWVNADTTVQHSTYEMVGSYPNYSFQWSYNYDSNNYASYDADTKTLEVWRHLGTDGYSIKPRIDIGSQIRLELNSANGSGEYEDNVWYAYTTSGTNPVTYKVTLDTGEAYSPSSGGSGSTLSNVVTGSFTPVYGTDYVSVAVRTFPKAIIVRDRNTTLNNAGTNVSTSSDTTYYVQNMQFCVAGDSLTGVNGDQPYGSYYFRLCVSGAYRYNSIIASYPDSSGAYRYYVDSFASSTTNNGTSHTTLWRCDGSSIRFYTGNNVTYRYCFGHTYDYWLIY